MELISITKEKIMDSASNIFSPPDRTLLCVRKVIYVNNTPIMYGRAFLPSGVSDGIVEELSDRFIIDALRRHKDNIRDISLLSMQRPPHTKHVKYFRFPLPTQHCAASTA
ncbi:hypothetical protein CBM2633_P350015 [Cupriavidus taiwanensis]|uniref:Uncharacterized protein n=3 Tax=Cupriavidus TaxID=106589 RepID=A0A375CNY6_9BURK|nr:hypothetical protein CBM2585_P350011 [Cupriavidus taiwanensis]SOZ40652.1 hypothetical protein CBM2605_P350013 [Cupriavidus neocaledonicus]SOY75958.1 hypothetical protein CBM2588_P390010 [Cupriavidus taiwanensis]SOY76782.1 hypothetical protein CBM2589_P350014 [Cupriavidus taiwanensis]SOY78029.1 hypothetical protein CBM2586_P360012 [Cupriavidus taiwanensis]